MQYMELLPNPKSNSLLAITMQWTLQCTYMYLVMCGSWYIHVSLICSSMTTYGVMHTLHTMYIHVPSRAQCT